MGGGEGVLSKVLMHTLFSLANSLPNQRRDMGPKRKPARPGTREVSNCEAWRGGGRERGSEGATTVRGPGLV